MPLNIIMAFDNVNNNTNCPITLARPSDEYAHIEAFFTAVLLCFILILNVVFLLSVARAKKDLDLAVIFCYKILAIGNLLAVPKLLLQSFHLVTGEQSLHLCHFTSVLTLIGLELHTFALLLIGSEKIISLARHTFDVKAEFKSKAKFFTYLLLGFFISCQLFFSLFREKFAQIL